MKKFEKLKRIFAFLLVAAMVLQQSSVTTLADEIAEMTENTGDTEQTVETPVEEITPETTEAEEQAEPATETETTQAPTATVAPTEVATATEAPAATEAAQAEVTPEPTKEAAEATTTTFSSSVDNGSASVTLSQAISEKAQFIASYYNADSDYFANNVDAAMAQWVESNGLTVADVVAYDMHFEKDGAELAVAGQANVNLTFSTPILNDGVTADQATVYVLHIVNGQAVNVGTVTQDANGAVTAANITTDGFSPFVFVKATKTDSAVQTVNKNGNSSITGFTYETSGDLRNNGTISGKFTFTIKNVDKQHASYDFTIPVEYLTLNDNASGYIRNESGIKIGAYTLDKTTGVVTITFDESFIKSHSDVSGYFAFTATVKSDAVVDKDSIEIKFNDDVKATIELTPGKITGGKSGNFVEGDDGNLYVDYKVTVTANKNLSNFKLTDTLGDNQEFVSDSFTWKKDSGTAESINPNIDGKVAIYSLNAIAKGTYEFSYRVKVLDRTQSGSLGNTAKWTWDGGEDSTSSSVWNNTSWSISKYSTDNGKVITGDTASWKVTIKGTNTTTTKDKMTTGTYKDTIPTGMSFDSSSLVITDTADQKNIRTLVADTDYTVVTTDTGFTIVFKDKNATKVPTYEITYKTKVTGTQTSGTVYKNKGGFTPPGEEEKTSEDSVKYSIGPGFVKTVDSNDITYDDEGNATANWTINVEPKGETLKNVIISDTFNTAGTGVLKSSIKVTTGSGKDVAFTINDSYTSELSNHTDYYQKFGIDISGDVTEKLIVTYTSTTFADTASTGWVYNGAKLESDHDPQDSHAGFNFNKSSKAEEVMEKSGAVDGKYYKWTITLNQDSSATSSCGYASLGADDVLSVDDIIPEGMTLVEDEEKYVPQQIIGWYGKGKTSLTYTYNKETRRFEASITNFLNNDGSKVGKNFIQLIYWTKLDESSSVNGGDKSYTNNASYSHNGELKDTKSYTIEVKGSDLNKTSANDTTDNIVTYTVDVNPNGKTLNDGNELTLTDEIPSGCSYVPSSLKFSEGEDAVISHTYKDGTLSLKIKDSTHVKFTYEVLVLGNVGTTVTVNNKITLSGKSEISSSDSKNVTIQKTTAGATGEKGIFTISKIDSETEDSLAGAEFVLYKVPYDNSGNFSDAVLVDTKTTNENGLASFGVAADASGNFKDGSILYDTLYYWQETKAPSGYKLSDEEKNTKHYFYIAGNSVTTFQSYLKNAGITAEQVQYGTYIVSNERSKVGNLTFTKTITGDVTADDLADIEFTVKKGDETVKTVKLSEMTEKDGKYTYTLENIAPGEYTVTESNAEVKGYNVTTTYSVDGGKTTVKDKETATVDIKNEYSKQAGNLTFTKTIEGDVTAEDLANIEFTVKKGDEAVKTVKLSEMTEKDGKYTYTLENIAPGEYTVTESNAEVKGYNVTTTYSVEGGKTTVKDKETATVDIKNEYSKQAGNLTFTKTIEGDVTADDLANIEFTVKKGDETVKTVKLSEMTEKDGKYTYTLENIAPGEYTVTESNAEVKGYNVTTTYSVEGGKTTVKDKETATVDIKNEYSKQAGNLTFTKTIEGDVTAENLANIEFTVKKGDEAVKTVKLSEMTEKDGKYTYTLENIAPGEYTVTESNAEVKGYNVTTTYSVEGGKTTVKDKETATVDIKNEYSKQAGNLTFTKTIEGDVTAEDLANIEFTVKKGDEAVKTVKLSEMTKGEDGKYTYTLENIAPGEYTVTESNAEVKGYNVTTTYSVEGGKTTVKDKETATVDIKNEYSKQAGNLTFTKTITGDVTADDLANIEFTVKKGDEAVKTVKLSEMTKGEDGKYTYTLENIAPGEYTVTESNAEVKGYNVTTTYSVEGGKTTVKDKETATVDIKNEYSKQAGNLTFTKTIEGDVTADDLANIEFTVKKGDETVKTVKLSEMTEKDGKYTYTLENIAPGEYTVTESNAEVKGYNVTTTYSVDGGKTTVKDKETATVDIKNEYSKQAGNLTFTKTIEGDVTADDLADIEFTVKKGDETVKTVKLSEMTKGEDGKYTYTLENIAPGEYTVTESNAEVKGYNVTTTYSVEGGKTTVKDKETATVDIKNEYSKQAGNLTFTKTIEGDVTADDLANIEFTVKKGDETVKTVKLSEMTEKDGKYTYTLENIAPGEYTVTESNAEVEGYNVTTTYSVEGGKTTVKDKETATVDITNKYEYETHDVEISKIDINGNELKGAKLTVVNSKKETVDTWTSGDETHTVTVEPGTYTLIEEQTPSNKYVKASNIEFTVDKDGKVTVADKDVDKVTMVDEFADGSVYVSKTDINGAEIKGAQLKITGTTTDGKEIKAIEWTSDGESARKVELKPGTYTLTETATPDNNYVKASDITFTLDENGKITIDGKEAEKVTMVDDYSEHNVNISKVDINGAEIEGAQLEITGKTTDGKDIDKISWTSDGTTKTVSIKPGTYTLTESAAPEGGKYVKASSIEFTVDAKGNVTRTDGVDVKDATIVMTDEYAEHDVVISKEDVNGKEISGAQLKVTGTTAGGKEIEAITWTSGEDGTNEDGTVKTHVVSVEPGTYTLEETETPSNQYVKASNITFTVDADGKVKVADADVEKVTMVDDYATHEVKISKTDINGEELKGAKLEITGKTTDGKDIDKISWESDGTTKTVELKPGTYTLHESETPSNQYVKASDITFTVDVDGKVKVADKDVEKVTMVDDYNYGKLVITKTIEGDVTTEEVNGALKFKITGPDLAEGKELTLADFTQKDGKYTYTLDVVNAGAYTVEETAYTIDGFEATVTYTVNAGDESTGTKAEATVNNGETATVDFKDVYAPTSASVAITKQLKLDNGDDLYAEDATFYVALYNDKELTDPATDAKEIKYENSNSQTVRFTDLTVGKTYYVAECDEEGNATNQGAIVAGDDTAVYQADFTDGNTFIVTDENGNTEVHFDNVFTKVPDGYYKTGKIKITKKVVDASGNAKKTNETFYVNVYSDEECTNSILENAPLAINMNGSSEATVEVKANVENTGSKYYVVEVDENGDPVTESKTFAYKMSKDKDYVELTEDNATGTITITNKENTTTVTPTPTTTNKKTTTGTSTKSAVKTGDNTPIAIFLVLLVAAVAVIVFCFKRRKKNNQ